jgi:acyl-coenzyme A synthetase/AMP-(fatty) acid ligase
LREEVPVAFVVPRAPGLASEEVLDWCRQQLAPHKVPATLYVVESLPKTAVGKIEKKVLRASLQQQEQEQEQEQQEEHKP